MKFYHNENNGLTIEDGNGGKVVLTVTDAGVLYCALRNDALWDEVAMRFEEHPQWEQILEAKEDILDELYYENDDEMADAVYNAVERWVDLDEEEEQD